MTRALFQPLAEEDPRVLGPYEILAVLGEGGMGRVFLGRAPGEEDVAIKMIKQELRNRDEVFLRRFQKELEATQKVGARFTPALHHCDLRAPEPWIAVRYIKAPNLRWLIDTLNEPLPVRSVLWLMHRVAEALEAIAEQQLIHRDLHARNILVRREGPLIIDFGLARDLNRPVTQQYKPWGAPGYIAPEQIRSNVHTFAADVYSLGACMAYAATGHDPPVNMKTMVLRTDNGDPDIPGLPEELRFLISACMAENPLRRPTAAQLAEHISVMLGGIPPAVATDPWLPPTAIKVLREIAETPVSEWFGAGPPASSTLPLPQSVPDWQFSLAGPGYYSPSLTPTTVFAAALKGRLHAIDRLNGTELWSFDTEGRIECAAATGEGRVVVPSSDRCLYALDAHTGKRLWKVELGNTVGSPPLIVRDRVFLGDLSGGVQARSLNDGRLLWRFQADGPVHARPTVAEGTVFVGSWGRSMFALDLETGGLRWGQGVEGQINAEAVLLDGLLVFGSGDHLLHAVDRDHGAPRWTFPTGGAMHWTPEAVGGRVFAASADGCFYSVEGRAGGGNWHIRCPARISCAPALLGSDACIACIDGSIYAVDRETGMSLRRYVTGEAPVTGIVTDGDQLYASTRDGRVSVLSIGQFTPVTP